MKILPCFVSSAAINRMRNHQIPAIAEIQPGINQDTHAHGRNHTIKHNTDSPGHRTRNTGNNSPKVVGKNFMIDPGIHRTILGDGIATAVAGLLGGPANTNSDPETKGREPPS